MEEKNQPERFQNNASKDLSKGERPSEYQELFKAYQNMKYERDILRKALKVYHQELGVPVYPMNPDINQ